MESVGKYVAMERLDAHDIVDDGGSPFHGVHPQTSSLRVIMDREATSPSAQS